MNTYTITTMREDALLYEVEASSVEDARRRYANGEAIFLKAYEGTEEPIFDVELQGED